MFGWLRRNKDKTEKLFMEKEVRRGIALLNEKQPGWSDRIEREHLRMSNTDDCVLGQLYGDYYDGVDELEISGQEYEYGFDLKRYDVGEWEDLRNTWLTLMPKRAESLV